MTSNSPAHPRGFLHNFRKDTWWNYPLFTAIVLGAFGVYSLYAAYMGRFGPETFHYAEAGRNYLSPFFSPCINGAECEHVLFKIGDFAQVSPAWFVMWAPLGLRATCYYYRKAYYRAFFFSPTACAIDEPRSKYRGETAFPFVLQNLHRYFLYVALLFPVFLFYDAYLAFFIDGDDFVVTFTALVMLANAVLLTGFTFGCHALRHMVGGRLDCFSCSSSARGQHGLYKGVTWFNKHHGKWAWVSLVWVGLTDLQIRALANGWWNFDPVFFGGA